MDFLARRLDLATVEGIGVSTSAYVEGTSEADTPADVDATAEELDGAFAAADEAFEAAVARAN